MSDQAVRLRTPGRRQLTIALSMALILCLTLGRAGHAQGIVVEAPFNLSNTTTSSIHAALTADRTGLVHVFWNEDVGGPEVTPGRHGGDGNTLMYAAWDGQAWSEPVDLFYVSQGQNLTSPQATVDGRGVLHVAWFEGADRLKYSQAPVAAARSAQAWAWPVELDTNAGAIELGLAIVADGDEIVHLAYAAGSRFRYLGEPRTVNYLRSTDGGASWSEPVVLGQVTGLAHGASDVRLLLDPAGRLHASWEEWNADGFGDSVHYARSTDHGETWTPDEVVDSKEPDKTSAQSFRGRIVVASADRDRLFRVWLSGPPADWYYQTSADGGASWGAKTRLFPDLRGEQGAPTFATDGAGRLHLFIGQRGADGGPIPGSTIGLWHSYWNGAAWSPPIQMDGNDDALFNPSAAIVRGNQLVVIWWSHEVAEVLGWLGRVEGAPTVAGQPWPTPTPGPSPTPRPLPPQAPAAQPAPAPPAAPRTPAGSGSPPTMNSTVAGLVIPVLASLLLVAGVVIVHSRRKRR